MNGSVILFISFILLLSDYRNPCSYQLPVDTGNRQQPKTLMLTGIGQFGLPRKARSSVPAHLHTGIDIQRPTNNYYNEPVYPIAEGTVISIRRDGPYSQIIIEHDCEAKFWTVYEHIAGIKTHLFEHVTPNSSIARFMNRNELENYGWQFDHFHFEILKKHPIELAKDNTNPERMFASYTLSCYTLEKLQECFYDPIEYLHSVIK